MKHVSIREFRAQLADVIAGAEPVVITRHGRPSAVIYPLTTPNGVPEEVRRDLIESVAKQLGIASTDPTTEAYKRGIDRGLIRENLRRTPTERLQTLVEMQRLQAELRR